MFTSVEQRKRSSLAVAKRLLADARSAGMKLYWELVIGRLEKELKLCKE